MWDFRTLLGGWMNVSLCILFAATPVLQHLGQTLLVPVQAWTWGGGQRASPRCAEHVPHQHWLVDLCACFTWCVSPLQHTILRPFSPLGARVKHSYIPFLPFTSYCKRTISLKIKKTQIPWPEESRWGVREPQMPSNFWKFDFVFALFSLSCRSSGSCCAGPAMDVSRLPLKGDQNFLKSSGEVWAHTALQTWASPADTI